MLRASRSVLATQNSTPSTLASIMRFTALPPPPPTPITLIFAPRRNSSEKSTLRFPLPFSFAMLNPPNGCLPLPSKDAPKFAGQSRAARAMKHAQAMAVNRKAHHCGIRRIGKRIAHGFEAIGLAQPHRQIQRSLRRAHQSSQLSAPACQDNTATQLSL